MGRYQVTLAQSQSQSENRVSIYDARHTVKISIALLIQSLDLLWSAGIWTYRILLTLKISIALGSLSHWDPYRTGIPIALAIRSFDLFARLIPAGVF